jgi:hypothetical protein
MKQESQYQLTRKLLGYFMIEDTSGGCLIVDPLYSVESLYYPSEDEKQPQIIIPIGAELDPKVPRYYELGYIPVGVYASFDLTLEAEIPEFVDIPVYAISQDDLPTSIVVEIEEWIPALKILDEEQDEELRKKTYAP